MNYNKKKHRHNPLNNRWIFTKAVYDEICATIGTREPEWGGILGSDDNVHITHYYFDRTCKRNSGIYTMDEVTLNNVIRMWNDNGTRFVGVIHSHPYTVTAPSLGDAKTAEKIITAMDVDGELFTPIVQVSPELDGNIRIYPYTFKRSVEVKPEKCVIEREPSLSKEERRLRNLDRLSSNRFARLEGAFPYSVMRKKAVICIGCGGSRDFLETLARNGVSTFYLYDKDTVEDTNIATQGTFVSEIGKLKVDVIKERILDINPLAKVYCFAKHLDDDVTDKEFVVATALKQHNKQDVILCGCTDNALAQMRCELLSWKYDIPYLAAQIYAGGNGHEVIFTYPGLTKSCTLCMVHTRYRNIFSKKLPLGGSSEGTSVWVTNYLNAIKTYLALCMFCYDEPNTSYYRELNKYADSNYFMSRCSDSLDSPVFKAVDQLFTALSDLTMPFGTVAIEQIPEENCPLCSPNAIDRTRDKKNCDTRLLLREIVKGFVTD